MAPCSSRSCLCRLLKRVSTWNGALHGRPCHRKIYVCLQAYRSSARKNASKPRWLCMTQVTPPPKQVNRKCAICRDGKMVTSCGMTRTSHCALYLRAHAQSTWTTPTLTLLYITLMATPVCEALQYCIIYIYNIIIYHSCIRCKT